ncbi:MAG: Sir2 family NAD-dependent protein deacetylase, partial [Bauldia litoralis]
ERRVGRVRADVVAHKAAPPLARLEAEWPGEVLLVTQNIDNLHEEGGSKNLIHMHGEMFKARCEDCHAVHDWREDLSLQTHCPACEAPGGMRPHVVWFGEMPFDMERIYAALATCRLFVSVGTSGNVYPAAGFVQEAIFQARAHTVELNLEPSEGATMFAETQYGPATEIVPRYVDTLLAEGW